MFRKRAALFASLGLVLVIGGLAITGHRATSHPTTVSESGVSRPVSALEAVLEQPGPLTVETVVGVDWQIARSGLINLDNPTAKAAHLVDGDEPIQIMFHAIHHPTRGLFIIDTGVERALRDDPSHAAIHGYVASLAHVNTMKFRTDTAAWLARQNQPLQGVFLTHLHVDHVSGMRDVPPATPIYVGAGEAEARNFMNFFIAGTIDSALEGKGALREWQFSGSPGDAFEGILDVFGDGSLWALSVPGHTVGSVAYLARTTAGPVLFVGDASHTVWGWQNRVEPGTFSEDRAKGIASLDRLHRLVDAHPSIDVRLGHQQLPRPSK